MCLIEVKIRMTDFSIAQTLAADLAGARVDPNEAQKALAYLRSTQDGKQFFAYLRAIVQDGRAVIRSGQTLDYYRNLLAACERHLRGMDADAMLQTLGWAIRLLRYYRVAPEAAQEQAVPLPPPAGGTTAESRKPQPAAPQLPAVGEVFTGKVLERDETAVVVQVPGFDESNVFAVLKVESNTPRWTPGKDSARVEVVNVRTLKNGKTVLEVRRAVKQSK